MNRAELCGIADRIVAWGDLAAAAMPDFQRSTELHSLDAASAVLTQSDRGLIHATGWEMRNAIRVAVDGYCVEAGTFAGISHTERVTDSLQGAMELLASDNAAPAALVTAWGTRVRGLYVNPHSAMIAEARDGQRLVVDHVVNDAADGVATLERWLRSLGPGVSDVRVHGTLIGPPRSLQRGGGGIPPAARRQTPDELRAAAGRLAASARDGAQFAG